MIIIILLVILDYIIKGLIYFNFMDIKIKFFGDWLGFVPLINKKQMSMFNLEFDMAISTPVLIGINLAIFLGLLAVYFRSIKLNLMNVHVKIILALFISGNICSLFDKVVLGGSLDYILIKKWIIDFKDIYLFAAVIYLIVYLLMTGNLTKNNDIQMLKDFFGMNKKS